MVASFQDAPQWSSPLGIYNLDLCPPTLYHGFAGCPIQYSRSDGVPLPRLGYKWLWLSSWGFLQITHFGKRKLSCYEDTQIAYGEVHMASKDQKPADSHRNNLGHWSFPSRAVRLLQSWLTAWLPPFERPGTRITLWALPGSQFPDTVWDNKHLSF